MRSSEAYEAAVPETSLQLARPQESLPIIHVLSRDPGRSLCITAWSVWPSRRVRCALSPLFGRVLPFCPIKQSQNYACRGHLVLAPSSAFGVDLELTAYVRRLPFKQRACYIILFRIQIHALAFRSLSVCGLGGFVFKHNSSEKLCALSVWSHRRGMLSHWRVR